LLVAEVGIASGSEALAGAQGGCRIRSWSCSADTVLMIDSTPRESRFYYQPLARIYMRGYAVLGVVTFSVLAGAPRLSAPLRTLAVAVGIGYVYSCWRSGGRGLEARQDGIRFRRWFRSYFIPWQEIQGFKMRHPGALSPTVLVDLVSGEVRVLPFTQGRLTRWNGGKTRDTVAVLNSELAGALTAKQS
jgi:hypothetical protein